MFGFSLSQKQRLVDLEELNLELESRVGGARYQHRLLKDNSHDGGEAAGTVGVVGGGGEDGLLAKRELGDTLVPTLGVSCATSRGSGHLLWSRGRPIATHLDNLSDTDLGLEWLSAVARRVKLGAVEEGSDVVDGDGVTGLGEGLAVAGGETLMSVEYSERSSREL